MLKLQGNEVFKFIYLFGMNIPIHPGLKAKKIPIAYTTS